MWCGAMKNTTEHLVAQIIVEPRTSSEVRVQACRLLIAYLSLNQAAAETKLGRGPTVGDESWLAMLEEVERALEGATAAWREFHRNADSSDDLLARDGALRDALEQGRTQIESAHQRILVARGAG